MSIFKCGLVLKPSSYTSLKLPSGFIRWDGQLLPMPQGTIYAHSNQRLESQQGNRSSDLLTENGALTQT